MAKLEHLEDFDRAFNLALNDIRTLATTRGAHKGVWSPQQEKELSQLIGSVQHLVHAVQHLVRLNR